MAPQFPHSKPPTLGNAGETPSIDMLMAPAPTAPPGALPWPPRVQHVVIPGIGEYDTIAQGPPPDPLAVLLGYVKRHPATVGAIGAGLAAAPFTGGMSLVPSLATGFGLGAAGAGAGLGVNKLLGGEATQGMTLPQAGKEMAIEGANMAAGEGVLRGLAGLGKAGANMVMDNVIGAQRGVRTAFGGVDIADWLNRHFVNPMTKRGLAKAERLRGSAVEARNALTSAADVAGVPPIIPIVDPTIEAELADVLRQAAKMRKSGAPDPTDAILARRRALDAENPLGISMRDTSDIIQALADEGAAAQRAFNAGQLPHDIPSDTAKALADGLRRVQRRQVPGVEPLNRQAQAAIEATRIAKNTSEQPFRIGGWRSVMMSPAAAYGANAITHSWPQTVAAGAVPLLLGTPLVAAPGAMTAYQIMRLLGTAPVGRTTGALADPVGTLLGRSGVPLPPENPLEVPLTEISDLIRRAGRSPLQK